MVLPEPTGPPMPMRGGRILDMFKGRFPTNHTNENELFPRRTRKESKKLLLKKPTSRTTSRGTFRVQPCLPGRKARGISTLFAPPQTSGGNTLIENFAMDPPERPPAKTPSLRLLRLFAAQIHQEIKSRASACSCRAAAISNQGLNQPTSSSPVSCAA